MAAMFRQLRRLPDPAALFRHVHEAWLTRAVSSGKPYPRIPVRRVDEGGFDPLLARPGGRQRADRWWTAALDRVDD
jgi:hypothetical protein